MEPLPSGELDEGEKAGLYPGEKLADAGENIWVPGLLQPVQGVEAPGATPGDAFWCQGVPAWSFSKLLMPAARSVKRTLRYCPVFVLFCRCLA